MFEQFGRVIAPGGAGVVSSSQSGHRLPALTPEEDRLLAATPTDELLDLPMLRPEAVRWGERGARVNAINPGIIITPLA